MRVLVGVEARQRLGIVAVDVDRHAVGAQLAGSRLSSMPAAFSASSAPVSLQPASITFSSNTSRVPCLVPGMKARMSCVRQVGVDVVPGLVRVVDQLAVLHHLGGDGVVPVGRGEGEGRAVDVRGEDDAVIADADFHDLVDAVGLAGVDVGLLDPAATSWRCRWCSRRRLRTAPCGRRPSRRLRPPGSGNRSSRRRLRRRWWHRAARSTSRRSGCCRARRRRWRWRRAAPATEAVRFR